MPLRQYGISRGQTILLVSILALFFAIGGNVAVGVQAHKNCHDIEHIKTRLRDVISQQYDDLLSGRSDSILKQIYGATWPDEKEDAIVKAQQNLEKFKAVQCKYFLVPWES